MSLGLLGIKLGMTHAYDPYGRRRAVTVIRLGPCTILDIRDPKKHGYRAVQVGFEPIQEKKQNKAQLGQFKKAGAGPFRYVREFRLRNLNNGQPAAKDAKTQLEPEFKVGQELKADLFQQFELVDVAGISIGKGFQGGMKRWNWRGGNETHGSMSHRAPGSIGSTTTPGRVWKGHHLPGHMGMERVTIQSLRVSKVDLENNLLLVEGAIPGAENALVLVSKSVKRPGFLKKPQEIQTVFEDDEGLSKTAKAASKKLKQPTAAAKA